MNGARRYVYVILISLLSSIPSLTLVGCTKRKPIQVGFAGELTGKRSDLGVHGRDGALLAVEMLNDAGGVAERALELLVRDDLGTPEGAQAADRELIDAGVVAIIGHMTSAQSVAALPVTEEAGMVLVAPTASTAELSGLDDYFFRVSATNTQQAPLLAHHIYQRRELSRLAVIYDDDNAAFSQSFWIGLVQAYQALGGQVSGEVHFSSSAEPDFAPLVTELRAGNPQGLLIIASALDTALIAQRVRLDNWQVPLFSSGWAQTDVLLQNGGQAVEGIEFIVAYNANRQSPAFLDFQARYQARFGRASTFASAHAYDAVMVLAAALEKTGGQAKGLPQALAETRDFEGLMGTISMDEYGDAVRTHFLITVQEGQFVPLDRLEPGRE
ncbi:MAG: ABC transporter substrate-binding protein [Anaerolineae bacterium]|jgi:branched-chain amino acid transport system substrate-binding protein